MLSTAGNIAQTAKEWNRKLGVEPSAGLLQGEGGIIKNRFDVQIAEIMFEYVRVDRRRKVSELSTVLFKIEMQVEFGKMP